MNKKSELTIIPGQLVPAEIDQNISAINAPLNDFLVHVGLPTNNLLSPIDERRKVIQALESVLEVLPMAERQKSTYISKFAICVTVGLFDGALSFLWDETVNALRQKVISFDLQYFYAVAQTLSSKYKGLKEPKEISAISEHDLLEVCRRIGILDDINHRRLDQVNFFRNHASAAHPTEIQLSGIELLGFLEHCLKFAICAPLETSVVQVKRFLENVRQHEIPAHDFSAISSEIAKLQTQRIEDILTILFGMFCDPAISQTSLDNIRGLAPHIWRLVGEDLRYRIGSKIGYYRANGDIPRKDRAQLFLETVDGNQYKDEDSLGAELIEKLQFLRSAHYSINNFYNEFPHALSVEQSMPAAGIPTTARYDFVKTISTCFIGNGCGYRDGVDENALPIYKKLLSRVTESEIVIFVKLFSDHEFTTDLSRSKSRERAIQLANFFRTKIKNPFLLKSIEAIVTCPDLQKVSLTIEYREAIAELV